MKARPSFGLVLLLLSPLSLIRGGEAPVIPAPAGSNSAPPVASVPGTSPAQAAEPAALAPAVNWVLPLFSDKDGHRIMTLRGTEVRPVGAAITVTNLNITIFSGDATARVDSILLSPRAVFLPKENRAHGDESVRFIQDDIEVTGSRWTYDHAARKVSLRENVRVTFDAKLNDILK